MKTGFRQSMAWLHTWTGLLLGWLLFAIFLTGTIAFFRDEVGYWMTPELHGSAPGPDTVAHALARLEQAAPGARNWTIALPDSRNRTIELFWQMPDEQQRRRGPREVLDAGTGAVLTPRETRGGDFLYRFHFELYALPRDWARWIVGAATMMMFVSILSGIVTHKKIFADFFTLRLGKGQRSWLDAHAVAGVLALPFHIVITYSGLLLLMATLIPWNASERRPPQPQRPAAERPVIPAALTDLTPLLAEAEARWGMPAGRIAIDRPGTDRMTVELAPQRNSSLIATGGGGGTGVQRLRYDGVTGKLVGEVAGREVSAAQAVYNAFGTLHRGRFAQPALRWLYFLSGVAGTVMVASGLVLWTVKRAKNQPASFGRRLVLGLNVGGVAGLTAATAVYFWANRLVPAGLPGRIDWEIGAFFLSWALLALYPLARPARRAWIEQLTLAGVLFAGLPVLNALTSQSNLLLAMASGDWMLAGFDLVAVTTGIALCYAARRIALNRPKEAPRRRRQAEEGAETPILPPQGAAHGTVHGAAHGAAE